MKKLSIFLCVCAAAVAGLIISCKNGTTEYVNVTSTTQDIYYKVSGTVTNTRTTGTTSSFTTNETVYTYENALGRFYHEDKETSSYNYTSYSINVRDEDTSLTECEKDSSGNVISGTSKKLWYSDSYSRTIYKIDGSYYVWKDNSDELLKIDITGSFGGKEFKIVYEDITDDTRTDLTQAAKDDTTSVNKASTKVELTFTRM